MTTDHIKAVTELIDSVLDGHDTQHSPEATLYGDVAPVMPAEGRCWRCPAPAAEDSPAGLCAGCRAFLLEDSDDDPVGAAITAPAPAFSLTLDGGPVHVPPEDAAGLTNHFCQVFPGFAEWRASRPPQHGIEVVRPDGTVVVERTEDYLAAAMAERWQIRGDVTDDVWVSTVFLTLDHDHYNSGVGVWYETMVFGGEHDRHQERYATRGEAEIGHRRICATVRAREGVADVDAAAWAELDDIERANGLEPTERADGG